MIPRYRKHILVYFALLSIASIFFVTKLKFSFGFEQFFPQGDEDLAFFKEFIDEFETDDNFLLISFERQEGVFDSDFLGQVHHLSLELRKITNVKDVQSLTTMRYPIKTPFGYSSIPILHINNKEKLKKDSIRVMEDPRFVNNLINESGTAITILTKTTDTLSVEKSNLLMSDVRTLIDSVNIGEYHMLGRAYFQEALINNQKKEIFISGIVSVVFVSLILFLILRKWTGVVIALVSISISLLIFMGILGATGRPLSIMSALYPVLMLIVGCSDVIHIMSKYLDELNKGATRSNAINTTVKEIGMATFITSLTTAIGFATLLTSRLQPVRDFGLNSAIGVLVAYVATILITTSLLSFFDKERITELSKKPIIDWDGLLTKAYQITLQKPKQIVIVSSALLLICFYGLSLVTTNYKVVNNLPRGQKVTEDFLFYEKEFSGFRPLEFAITTKNGYKADDYAVVKEINLLEEKLQSLGVINSIVSQATLYKSVSRMNQGNTREAYQFPDNEADFNAAKDIISRMQKNESTVLINRDRTKTRISSKIADIGADEVKQIGAEIDQWVSSNLDTSILSIKRTGTGLIIDKNSVYVTESLIYGLGLALIIISIFMAFLVKSWKMLILAFIPNIIPVIFAGALLGYFNIELEAGISIVFAVIFGIAVDDTIHFLSKYKLCRSKNLNIERSIEITFRETGKAITFTTIVLFFGFLIMLFSANPPTKTVGILISVTLFSALLCDLLLLPILMRKWLKD